MCKMFLLGLVSIIVPCACYAGNGFPVTTVAGVVSLGKPPMHNWRQGVPLLLNGKKWTSISDRDIKLLATYPKDGPATLLLTSEVFSNNYNGSDGVKYYRVFQVFKDGTAVMAGPFGGDDSFRNLANPTRYKLDRNPIYINGTWRIGFPAALNRSKVDWFDYRDGFVTNNGWIAPAGPDAYNADGESDATLKLLIPDITRRKSAIAECGDINETTIYYLLLKFGKNISSCNSKEIGRLVPRAWGGESYASSANTIGGQLVIRETNYNTQISLGNTQILKKEKRRTSIVGVYPKGKPASAVLLSFTYGGSACDESFAVLTIKSDKSIQLSPEIGHCTELANPSKYGFPANPFYKDGAWNIAIYSDSRKHPVEMWQYRNGKLSREPLDFLYPP